MTIIHFQPRWKEELVASSKDGVLIFELTMGKYHVYFPDQKLWASSVPAWAQDKWNLYYTECCKWCSQNHIPISITERGFVYEEKNKPSR